MKNKSKESFSWTLLFLVTGLCFLIFSGFLKLMNLERVILFFSIGFVSLAAGVIKWILQKNSVAKKDAHNLFSQQSNEQLN